MVRSYSTRKCNSLSSRCNVWAIFLPVELQLINITNLRLGIFMQRKLFLKVHMYIAAFFAPAVLLVAISGGLYLNGIKGTVDQETIYRSNTAKFDQNSATLSEDVTALLAKAGVVDYEFQYVKAKGAKLYTRPTSAEHYIIHLKAHGVEVIHARPSLQSRMVELHKGHGPTAFKIFQKVFAVGLILMIISGLWLGVSAARLRRSTLLTAGAGTAVFVLLLL
jgi:hypothetical protein